MRSSLLRVRTEGKKEVVRVLSGAASLQSARPATAHHYLEIPDAGLKRGNRSRLFYQPPYRGDVEVPFSAQRLESLSSGERWRAWQTAGWLPR